jgi:hypothetical protein
MVLDHTQIERGKRVACWSGPRPYADLQGVPRLESSRLSNMSNYLFVTVIT